MYCTTVPQYAHLAMMGFSSAPLILHLFSNSNKSGFDVPDRVGAPCPTFRLLRFLPIFVAVAVFHGDKCSPKNIIGRGSENWKS